jgi:hypothetical protein
MGAPRARHPARDWPQRPCGQPVTTLSATRWSLGRTYWLATAALLAAGLAGAPWGTPAAIALTAVQCVHFRAIGHDWGSLAVAVRAVFLGMLVAGLWPPLAFLHGLQCAGAALNALADYCVLARLLSLVPGYREAPLTWAMLRWTFLAPPAPGSIIARRREALHDPSSRTCETPV